MEYKVVEIYTDQAAAQASAQLNNGVITEVKRFRVMDCSADNHNCQQVYAKTGNPLYLVEYQG